MALYQSLVDRLRNQHEAIREIIASLSDERVHKHPQPGKWSIHENITHLVVYQPVFIGRMESILRDDEPLFGQYSADVDPVFHEWKQRDTAALLADMNTDRQRLFDFLTPLGDAELSRAGIHSRYGRLTIAQWVEFFLLHEAHHMLTMFRLANDIQA